MSASAGISKAQGYNSYIIDIIDSMLLYIGSQLQIFINSVIFCQIPTFPQFRFSLNLDYSNLF